MRAPHGPRTHAQPGAPVTRRRARSGWRPPTGTARCGSARARCCRAWPSGCGRCAAARGPTGAGWRGGAPDRPRAVQVGIAAPIVAATTAEGREAALGEQYGGRGGATAAADPVYQAIGQVARMWPPQRALRPPPPPPPAPRQTVGVLAQVVTISGRTIRNEAQASPLLAQLAIERIDALLAQVGASLPCRARGTLPCAAITLTRCACRCRRSCGARPSSSGRAERPGLDPRLPLLSACLLACRA